MKSFSILLVSLMLVSTANAQFTDTIPGGKSVANKNSFDSDEYTRIPLFIKRSVFLYCQAEIAGEKLTLLLDTGAATTILSHSFATKIKLDLEKQDFHTRFHGTIATTWSSTISKLRIGQFSRRNIPVTVLDMQSLMDWGKQHDDIEIDGILGADLLSSNGSVIDYHSRSLYMLCSSLAADLDRLQGTWKATELIHEGDHITDRDRIEKAHISIIGDSIILITNDIAMGGRLGLGAQNNNRKEFRVDSIPKPYNTLDTQSLCGQYEISENQLRLLIPTGDRAKKTALPTKFLSTKENRTELWTFVRYEVAPKPRIKTDQSLKQLGK